MKFPSTELLLELLSSKVGVSVVLQQIPLEIISLPPLEIISPPELAEIPVILEIGIVLISGGLFLEQLPNTHNKYKY